MDSKRSQLQRLNISLLKSLTNEERQILSGLEKLVADNGGNLDKSANMLALFLAKERDRGVTEQDYEDARNLIQALGQQDGSQASAAISAVLRPQGGVENFSNLRSPGAGSPKILADPAKAGYGRQAKPIGAPSEGGFYQVSGTFSSSQDSRQPASQVSEHDIEGTSRGSTPGEARSQTYGRRGYHYGEQRSTPGRTTTSTTKGILRSEIEKSAAGKKSTSDALEGIAVPGVTYFEDGNSDVAQPLDIFKARIITSSEERAVDKVASNQIKKSRETDLSKSR